MTPHLSLAFSRRFSSRSDATSYHEMFHHCRSGFLNVMIVILSRIPDVFRVKRFLKMQVSL